MEQTEAELESFRRKWREEVSVRARGNPVSSLDSGKGQGSYQDSKPKRAPPPALSASSSRTPNIEGLEELEPRAYHDLPNREDYLRLDSGRSHLEEAKQEPRSALEHYERAVDREAEGNLGDSVKLYRRAFKVCSNVYYKKMKLSELQVGFFSPRKVQE